MEILWISIIIIISISVLGLIIFFTKSNKSINASNNKIIKLPKMYFSGGIFISIVWLLFLIFLPYMPTLNTEEEILIAKIIFVILSLSGFIFAYYYLIWEIRLDDDEFSFRNWLGKNKVFKYDECLMVLKTSRIDIYCNNKRILKISDLYSNCDEMYNRIELMQ